MYRNIIFYSLPSLVSKSISLVLVPLYVATLSVVEFGQLEMLSIFGLFLQYLFHMGWSSAYMRLYQEEDIDTNSLTRTLLGSRIIIQTLLIFCSFLIGLNFLSDLIVNDEELSLLILWIILTYIVREFLLFFETKYRVLDNAYSFCFLNISHSLLQFIFIYYLMIINNMGITGFFLGLLVSCSIVLTIIFLIDYKWLLVGKFKSSIFKRCLKYGLPLMPAALAMFFMTSGDRYMLKFLMPENLGLKEVGIYALAFKFVQILMVFSAPFSIWWAPYVYRNYKKDGILKVFKSVYTTYILLIFLVSIFICIILEPVVGKFFKSYSDILPIVPLLISGFLIYNICDYFCIGIDIAERTEIRMYSGLAALFTNIVLNLILIPIFGGIGAAAATLISYFLYGIILMLKSQKFYYVPYPLKLLFFCSIWLVFASLIFNLFGNVSLLFIITGLGFCVYSFFVYGSYDLIFSRLSSQ